MNTRNRNRSRSRSQRRRRSVPRRRLRRWLRRQDRFTRVLLVAVVAVSVLIVTLILPRLSGERPPTDPERRARRAGTPVAHKPRETAPPLREPPVQSAPPAAPSANAAPTASRAGVMTTARGVKPRASIVIDDLGQSLSHLEQLARLKLPLSIAVIPGLPASDRTVVEASRLGIEMLLHQPMEPREETGKNPGGLVLLTAMSADALRAQVRSSIAAVPGLVGVNNHMGSRFTEDAVALDALMAELREHKLFWLDSRTTAISQGLAVARRSGVPAIGRDVFLDSEVNDGFIRAQVRKLIETARLRGTAVGIGHPHPETIAALRELREELLSSGVALVPVSTLVLQAKPTEIGPALAAATLRKRPSGPVRPVLETATP